MERVLGRLSVLYKCLCGKSTCFDGISFPKYGTKSIAIPWWGANAWQLLGGANGYLCRPFVQETHSPAVLLLLLLRWGAGTRAQDTWQAKIISLFSCCDHSISCSFCSDILLFSCLISQLWPYIISLEFSPLHIPFSLLHLLAGVSVKLSIPSLYFLARSMGTFLLMFVTKGLSQFFCGHAYPKHFKCCVPHC